MEGKRNSNKIGKAGEDKAVLMLREWWKDEHFMRNWIGSSGATGTMLAGNPHAPAYLIEALSGDVICPLNFPYSIEVKNYKDLDLYSIIRNHGNSDFHKFWKQAKHDSERISKIPLVILLRGKERFVMFEKKKFPDMGGIIFPCDGDLVGVALWEEFTNRNPPN